MEWLNIHTPTLRAPEYIGSEPASRATWLNVLAYCCDQENGGRIPGGAKWKDRQWQQTCGVTLAEIEAAAPLLFIEGDDIVVWRYPVEKQSEVQAKRKGGAAGGKAKAKHAAKHNPSCATSMPGSCATPSANSSPASCASTEGKGREEKGMEEEEETAPPHVAFRPTLEQAVNSCLAPKPLTEIWWNECMARSGEGEAPFLRFDGRPMASWQHDLTSYAQRERSRSAERMQMAGAKFVTPLPATPNPTPPKDPAGWKDWLAETGSEYREHHFAPDFLKTRFKNRK